MKPKTDIPKSTERSKSMAALTTGRVGKQEQT